MYVFVKASVPDELAPIKPGAKANLIAPLLNWHLQIWKSHQGNLQAKANLTDMLPLR